MTTYYNENDPKAAAWLRELIFDGHIAWGEVDERSIEDVLPSELAGYTQCHFFAGIGGWSLALRMAGWPDDRPVWTGSCPCQPFSAAGKGAGFADERHLWPAFEWLISQQKPSFVFGEQVASPDALKWLDVVFADLEGSDYACAAADLCAAGVGAPHIRQRLYWVANSVEIGLRAGARVESALNGSVKSKRSSSVSELADRDGKRRQERREPDSGTAQPEQSAPRRADTGRRGKDGIVGDTGSARTRGNAGAATATLRQSTSERDSDRKYAANSVKPSSATSVVGNNNNKGLALGSLSADGGRVIRVERPAIGETEPVRGFWGGADRIACRDGKWRPVEPGTFPLAHGVPGRVGLLRGYGNAIIPQVAAQFIGAYLEATR